MRLINRLFSLTAGCRVAIAALALLVFTQKEAMSQAGVVIDPTHIAETAAQGAARAEEFKAGYQNSLVTIESLEKMLKEMGINTKLSENQVFKDISANMPYLDTYMSYAREFSYATNTAERAINLTSQLVTGKVLNYNDALYIIKMDADYLTNLMRTYKLNKNIHDILRNDGYKNEEKRRHIQEARDTAGYYRVFFQNQIRQLEKIAAEKRFQDELSAAMGKAEAHNNVSVPSGGLVGGIPIASVSNYDVDDNYNYGMDNFWSSKAQWKTAIQKAKKSASVPDGKSAAAEIARPKKALARLVEAIIALLAFGYTVIAFIRVTKGEQQSQDAFIKIALGILFAAITIAVLEPQIVGKLF